MHNQFNNQISSSTIHNSLMKLTNTVGDHDKFRNMVLSAMSAYDKIVRKLIRRLASIEVKYKELEVTHKDVTKKLNTDIVNIQAEYESFISDQNSEHEDAISGQKSKYEGEISELKAHYEARIKDLEAQNSSNSVALNEKIEAYKEEVGSLRHNLMLMDNAVNIACSDFDKTSSMVSKAVRSVISEDYNLSNDNSTLNDELKIQLPPLAGLDNSPSEDVVPAEEAIDASAMGIEINSDEVITSNLADLGEIESVDDVEYNVPDSISSDVIELDALSKEIEEMMVNGAGSAPPAELPTQNTDTDAA